MCMCLPRCLGSSKTQTQRSPVWRGNKTSYKKEGIQNINALIHFPSHARQLIKRYTHSSLRMNNSSVQHLLIKNTPMQMILHHESIQDVYTHLEGLQKRVEIYKDNLRDLIFPRVDKEQHIGESQERKKYQCSLHSFPADDTKNRREGCFKTCTHCTSVSLHHTRQIQVYHMSYLCVHIQEKLKSFVSCMFT